MSAFGGKADIIQGVAKCPLIAKSGHESMSTNVRGADTGGRISKKTGPLPGPGEFHTTLKLVRDEEEPTPLTESPSTCPGSGNSMIKIVTSQCGRKMSAIRTGPLGMSAFGGKADMIGCGSKSPLIARSGHSHILVLNPEIHPSTH